jgi:hypothetical protein
MHLKLKHDFVLELGVTLVGNLLGAKIHDSVAPR